MTGKEKKEPKKRGVKKGSRNRLYSLETKLSTIEAWRSNGKDLKAVAEMTGIAASTIKTWTRNRELLNVGASTDPKFRQEVITIGQKVKRTSDKLDNKFLEKVGELREKMIDRSLDLAESLNKDQFKELIDGIEKLTNAIQVTTGKEDPFSENTPVQIFQQINNHIKK
jgi:transposase-like protein